MTEERVSKLIAKYDLELIAKLIKDCGGYCKVTNYDANGKIKMQFEYKRNK